MNKLRIWCPGNALLGDDAAGSRVAELLTNAGVTGVVDCGTIPENYIATLRRDPPDTLLIIDAADMGLPAGEVRLLSQEDIRGVADSSHGVPLSLLLEPFRETLEIAALGIQPASLRMGTPLSDAVEQAARRVADLVIKGEWRTVPTL